MRTIIDKIAAATAPRRSDGSDWDLTPSAKTGVRPRGCGSKRATDHLEKGRELLKEAKGLELAGPAPSSAADA